jgi:hypothetical protein
MATKNVQNWYRLLDARLMNGGGSPLTNVMFLQYPLAVSSRLPFGSVLQPLEMRGVVTSNFSSIEEHSNQVALRVIHGDIAKKASGRLNNSGLMSVRMVPINATSVIVLHFYYTPLTGARRNFQLDRI